MSPMVQLACEQSYICSRFLQRAAVAAPSARDQIRSALLVSCASARISYAPQGAGAPNSAERKYQTERGRAGYRERRRRQLVAAGSDGHDARLRRAGDRVRAAAARRRRRSGGVVTTDGRDPHRRTSGHTHHGGHGHGHAGSVGRAGQHPSVISVPCSSSRVAARAARRPRPRRRRRWPPARGRPSPGRVVLSV